MEFERIASGLYLEGLAIDHEREVIWYSDVIAGGVHGVKPDGTPVGTLNADRMWTGGVLMNADGAVLSSGQGGIMWNRPDTGRSGWLVDRLDGKPVNGINEMVPDGTGGIVFGTIDMAAVIAGAETEPTELWRLSPNGELVRIAEGIGFSNGLMFDAKRRRFYCSDTFTGVQAFDVTADFALRNRTLLLAKEDADGMTLDGEGNLWITGFRSGFFTRLDPEGRRLPDFPTSAGAITQLRFGGADGRDMVFTAVPSDGGDTLKEGGAITEAKSALFRGRSPLAGLKIGPARFALV